MEKGIIIGQIFKSLWEAIKELEPTEQAEIYNAIFQYQFTGEIPDFTNKYLKSLFISHKPTLDKMIQNQKAKIENGKKGGAPKGNNNAKKETTENNLNEKTDIENNLKQPKTTENKQKQAKVTINKKQEIKNKKQEIINKKQEEKKEIVALAKATPPPNQEIYLYFADKYKKHTGIAFLPKQKDFVLIANLCKRFNVETIKQKIDWLEVGCLKSVFWFAKDINDFSIGTLYTQWNYILPKLTDEQKKELAKRKAEEEKKKQVLEELAKQGINLEGGNNVRI